jgi:lactate dehydrogenase-like 2-hydroxyacid dehydrogenase
MTRLVVAELAENAERDLDIETAILGPDVDISRFAHTGDSDALAAACATADVILTDYAPFSRSVIAQLTQCRLISVAASGYNFIDVDAAAEASISVCAIDEYCTNEVADHVMLLTLALCRRLPEYHHQVQTQQLWQFDSLSGLRRLSDLTLGIVGFGKIGQAVARRARGFGMSVIAFDPYPNEAVAAELDVDYTELQSLFARADVISLNCGLTTENAGLIDAHAFAAMSRRPILINCARGGLIDEQALVEALDAGQISAAGLDVLSDESPELSSSQLTGRSNVILTPHVAFYSDTSILENRKLSATNIRSFLDGRHEDVRRYVHHAKS